jgi:outer membrane protein OmpA-like peptidoglycan-associated protein
MRLWGCLLAVCAGCGATQARITTPPTAERDAVADAEQAHEDVELGSAQDEAGMHEPAADDLDEDGFPNEEDACPGLFAASDDGCPRHLKLDAAGARLLLGQPLVVDGEGKLNRASHEMMEELRAALDARRELRLRIEAHTFEQRMDKTAQLELSKVQAAFVRDWLTQRGIAAPRFEVYGCGSARPKVSTRSRQRLQNRRIELLVVHPLPETGYPSTFGCEAASAPAAPAGQAEPAAAQTRVPVATPASARTTPASEDQAEDPDGDGLWGTRDRCPRAPGTRSLRGCPKRHRLDLEHGEISLLRRVQFSGDKLKPRSQQLLAEVAATLAANPSLHLRVDAQGNAVARAAAVRDFLAASGIAPARISAMGCPGQTGVFVLRVADGAPPPAAGPGCNAAP